MKKQFLILFAFISVLALSQVPQRFNKVIVTGDITSPKFIKTGSTADSVLLGNGSARAISAIKTDTVSLSNRINTKAAGNGTANGTNTGDETLTSIKTKLGAATSVSDGYLKYQDFVKFDGKEPAFSKNTAFNKNFGTTPGTVLEGRTFGTAANSAVGDFIQNQNSSPQSANMWIDGSGYFQGNLLSDTFGGFSGGDVIITTNTSGNSSLIFKTVSGERFRLDGNGDGIFTGKIISTVATGTAPLTVNSTTMVGNLNADLLDGNHASAFQPIITGLSTNYIPKWNGSSFVNSLISDDGASITLNGFVSGTNGLRLERSGHNSFQLGIDGLGLFMYDLSRSKYLINFSESDGHVSIPTTTQSTAPTTGALVVNGGVGADHVRANNFYGNGSNLTGVQLPITLTTNGTSGAATFSGNVLNVPNYAASGGVNQTQTTVNGSTGGYMVCSMPFQTGSYKKVIIYVNSLSGSATYTYPSSFSMIPRASSSLSITAQSTTSITIAGASAIGWCIIEGY